MESTAQTVVQKSRRVAEFEKEKTESTTFSVTSAARAKAVPGDSS